MLSITQVGLNNIYADSVLEPLSSFITVSQLHDITWHIAVFCSIENMNMYDNAFSSILAVVRLHLITYIPCFVPIWKYLPRSAHRQQTTVVHVWVHQPLTIYMNIIASSMYGEMFRTCLCVFFKIIMGLCLDLYVTVNNYCRLVKPVWKYTATDLSNGRIYGQQNRFLAAISRSNTRSSPPFSTHTAY